MNTKFIFILGVFGLVIVWLFINLYSLKVGRDVKIYEKILDEIQLNMDNTKPQ